MTQVPTRADSSRSVLLSLILAMAAVALVVATASIVFLYRTACDEELRSLQGSAETLAGIMESVAQFDILYSAHTHPEGSRGATLDQISKGMAAPRSARASEELIIGMRAGDKIRVMRRARGGGSIEDVVAVDADGTAAQPLLRALQGASGAGELLDYDREPVLAGYAYVPSIEVGVVYKVDLAEMRAPYLRAAGWASIIALLAIALGALSFARLVLPLRRDAQRRQQEQQARLTGIVESAMDVVITVDSGQNITLFNRAAERVFGYPAEIIIGQPLARLIPARFRTDHRRQVAGFGATGVTSRAMNRLNTVFGLRADGGEFPAEASISQIEIAGEKFYTVILRDVTQRKAAEEQPRSALAQKEVLLKEIYHRVKNNLQVVSSLLNLQGRGVADEATRRLLQESSNRVKSMALVHEQLYRSRDLSNIRFGEYARQLVEHLTQAHRPLSQTVPVRAVVAGIELGVETAIPCGLILNELISNAYKHGYGEGARGEIVLEAGRLDDGRVRLSVADDGRGLPENFDPMRTTSLGMRLVQTLVGQLEGELRHGSARGAWFEVVFRPEISEVERFI